MKIKELKECEKIYPEKIEGTSEWFYCNLSDGVDVEDILDCQDEYMGNKVYLIHISGKIFEPVKQEKNIYLSNPVYNVDDNAFAIVKFDFNKKIIQILKYDIETNHCSVVGEVPLSKGGDLINVGVLQNSYTLVKHENLDDFAIFLYPVEKKIQLEENEVLVLLNDNKLISFKWIEDPDYREEIIIRNFETNEVLERKDGFNAIMPNGEFWLLCK